MWFLWQLCFPGNNTEQWAVHLQSKQFQLLCSHDTRAEVTQFRNCHLARVPSHAIMVRPQLNHHAIYGLLDKAQVHYTHTHTDSSHTTSSVAYWTKHRYTQIQTYEHTLSHTHTHTHTHTYTLADFSDMNGLWSVWPLTASCCKVMDGWGLSESGGGRERGMTGRVLFRVDP